MPDWSPDAATATYKAPEERKTRGDVLLEAHKIINGERQGQYGEPEDSFQRIADKWNEYFNVDAAEDLLHPYDVAYMMFLMKLARIEGNKFKMDSFVDALGYLALACDMAEMDEKEKD